MLLVPSRKPFYLMLGTDSCCRSECRELKVLHKWEMELGKMSGWVRKKQEINTQTCHLRFCASVSSPPPMLTLCSLPASYCTSSFPSYPLAKKWNFNQDPLSIAISLCLKSAVWFTLAYFWLLSKNTAIPSSSLFCFPKYQSTSHLMTGFEVARKLWEINRKMKITVHEE